METHKVLCSDEEFLNEDVHDEQKKGWTPVGISIAMKDDRLVGCILYKKTVTRGEEWYPEPKIWKKHSP